MENEGNNSAEFSVSVNGLLTTNVIDFNLSSNDKNILILELDNKVSKNDVITISYLSGNLASEDGGILEFFESIEVINFLNYIVGTNQLPGKIEAEDYIDMHGIQTESTTDINGGINVGWIDDGDWIEYRAELQHSGTYFVNFRAASQVGGGKIKLLFDGVEKLSRVIPETGGWQSWSTVSTIADFDKGEFTIRIYAESGGFNLNWFEFVTITGTESNKEFLSDFSLRQNYPNPFNPTTNIKYSIPFSGDVKLTVYDILGKEIVTLVEEFKNADHYEVEFNSDNLSSGVYFYKLITGSFSDTKKMVLIR